MKVTRKHYPYTGRKAKAFACFLLGYGSPIGTAYLNTITVIDGDQYTMHDCITVVRPA